MCSRRVSFRALIVLLAMLAPPNLARGDLSLVAPRNSSPPSQQASHQTSTTWAGLVGAFVENVGQFPESARFLLRMNAGDLWIAADGAIWLTMHPHDNPNSAPDAIDSGQVVSLRLSFEGASSRPQIGGIERAQASVSYFKGAAVEQWVANAPLWQAVRITGFLSGLDLEMRADGPAWRWAITGAAADDLVGSDGEQGQSEGAALRLVIEGAQAVEIIDDQLRITTESGQVVVPRPETLLPMTVQTVVSGQAMNSVFDLAQSAFGETPAIPQPVDLVNDPSALRFGTFLGGAVDDYGTAIAVDGAGRVYVAGLTNSPSFPTTAGAYDRTHNGGLDIFVAQLNASGTVLEYATFIGGSGNDYANGIAVDGSGRVYVVGSTTSSNFPVLSGSFDVTHNGAQDVFVLRLASGGLALQYATFLGGAGQDEGEAVAVDSTGRAYVAGYTRSSNFPATTGAFDTTFNGGSDAFVVRLNATGSALDYATYAGGSSDDYAYEIAIDASGRVYVAGTTASSNFPTTPGAFDTTYNGGGEDAYALRLNAMGSALTYSTYLGGGGVDRGVGMATDSLGRSYVTGYTASSNFPVTANSFDSTYNGGGDVFIARLDSTGNSLDYCGFLGGASEERSFAVVADSSGRAGVVGSTRSSNFPVTSNAFDTSYNGGVNDAFLARVSTNGGVVEYATFLGGSGNDEGYAVALGPTGDLLVTGFTSSAGFPTTAGVFDTSHNGRDDAFVARLALATSTPTPTWTLTPTPTWTPTLTRTPVGPTNRPLFMPLLIRDSALPVTPTPTPTRTPTPIPGDPYEPNNTFAQAWGPLVSGQVYRALIYAPSDQEDFYWFDMPSARSIQVDLWTIPVGNDYHLYLYNAGFAQVGYSGNPGNQPESISTNILAAGRYYVRVQRVTGYSATQQYALQSVFR